MEAEKYVISTLNSRLELPFTDRGIQIFVTRYHLNLSKNKIKFDCMSVLNSVYAGKKKLKSADRPKLSITDVHYHATRHSHRNFKTGMAL